MPSQGQCQRIQISSGHRGPVNIVNAEVASQIAAKVQQCSTKLFTFNSEKPLTAGGKFTAQLRYKHRNVKCDFVVVEETVVQ